MRDVLQIRSQESGDYLFPVGGDTGECPNTSLCAVVKAVGLVYALWRAQRGSQLDEAALQCSDRPAAIMMPHLRSLFIPKSLGMTFDNLEFGLPSRQTFSGNSRGLGSIELGECIPIDTVAGTTQVQ